MSDADIDSDAVTISDADTVSDADTAGDAVVYEQFDRADVQDAPIGPGADWESDLRRLSDVPVQLSVEIGRTAMTVGETLDLRSGSIVTLDRLAGEPVDLLVNGTPIARGEVVVVDEQFGLRVSEIVEGEAGTSTSVEVEAGAQTASESEQPDAP